MRDGLYGQAGLGPLEADDTGGETPLGLVEVSGVIKWFDVAKASEGARIVCEAQERSKGLQAFRIISMDSSTAIHPAQLPPRTHVSVTPTSGLERAEVKWFNRLRGFGFLTRGPGTADIFVHMETLRRYGLTELKPGQTVLVRFGDGPKGLMAAEVLPDGPNPFTASH
jgi:cold shock protein